MHLRPLFIGLGVQGETITRLVMLFLVLLIAITAAACIAVEDPDDQDDLPGSAFSVNIFAADLFISIALLIPRLFTLSRKMHQAEYLDSHIGEKRFADDRLLSTRFVLFLVTALFAVPSSFIFRSPIQAKS